MIGGEGGSGLLSKNSDVGLHSGGRGGVSQKVTKGDRGEGGGQAYLVSPDDIISGRPLINQQLV